MRRAVELKLAKISAEITQKLGQFIEQKHPEFANVTPNYYEGKGVGGYQAIYHGHFNQDDPQILKVYFDEDGTVKEIYVSK